LSQTYVVEQVKEQIQKCVEKGFEFLDQSAKDSLYWHLENDFKISKELVAEKPAEFVAALYQIFGQGSMLLERRIASEIVRSFALSTGETDFARIVKLALKKVELWEEEKNWKR
jgi:ribulose bisphosphate carboxylase small subunit